MLKRNLIWSIATGLFVFTITNNSFAIATTYQLIPGKPIVLTNTLNKATSAYCLIQAVDSVVNSISINMLQGNSVVNGTTIQKGGTSFQNVHNIQYIPITASKGASARITNTGSYSIQAQCALG